MTLQDPFDEPTTDEAQTAPEATASVGTVTVDVVPVIRPVETGTEIVTTFKAGAGYDQPWVVIHAGSIAESNDMLDQEFKDYLERVNKVAAAFRGGVPAPASSTAASRPLQPAQPQGSVEAPSWAPPKPEGCEDFVYVTKVKPETGKVWHAWMPPGKDDARKAKFFYPPR